ncbi:MAG: hypothetical protein ACQESP_06090 [Candidatus Muiribacteriota bacterium]
MKKLKIMNDLKTFLIKYFKSRTVNIFSAKDIIKNSINKRILEIAVVNNVNVSSNMIGEFTDEFDYELKEMIISNLKIIKKIQNNSVIDYVYFTENGINELCHQIEDFVLTVFEKLILENNEKNIIN